MLTKYIATLVLLLTLNGALGHDSCGNFTNQDDCHREPGCMVANYKSCCGEQKWLCVKGTQDTCVYENTCYKNSDDIIEVSNSCLVPSGYTKFTPPEPKCSQSKIDECGKKGYSCEWKRLSCDNPTSCCPGYESCVGEVVTITGGSSGHPTSSGSSTSGGGSSGTSTSGGNESDCNPACPNGTHCVQQNGKYTCIVSTTGSATFGVSSSSSSGSPDGNSKCSTTLCAPGYQCVEKEGQVYCIKGGSSSTVGGHTTTGGDSTSGGGSTSGGHHNHACKNVECPAYYHCESKDGIAKCVKSNNNPCDSVDCPQHFHCEAHGENAKCVADVSPTSGGITIPPIDPCHNVNCPNKYHCENVNGAAHCKPNGPHPPSDKCNVHCPPHHECKIIHGVKKCIRQQHPHPHPPPPPPPPHHCRKKCPPHHECKVIHGEERCVRGDNDHGHDHGHGHGGPPNRCLTCRDMNCERKGLSCVMKPVPINREDCCDKVPVCYLDKNHRSSNHHNGGYGYAN